MEKTIRELEGMKAISIKQPFAYLICAGIKDIENRSWRTNFRGRVLIHAGVKPVKMVNPSDVFSKEQWETFNLDKKTLLMCTGTSFKPLSTSAIIGSVEIVDCIQDSESIWAEHLYEDNMGREKSMYNWVLASPILFEKPILNVKGKLSFFVPELPKNNEL